MNSLFIDVRVKPGASIERAAEDMMALAKQLGHTVCADFNGVSLLACVDGSAEVLVENWNREIQSGRPYQCARS